MPKYDQELREMEVKAGVVHGLSYQGSGMGGVLVLEAVIVPGNGKLKSTGRLGEVIQESAELALTWVRSRAGSLGIEDKIKEVDIHVSIGLTRLTSATPACWIYQERWAVCRSRYGRGFRITLDGKTCSTDYSYDRGDHPSGSCHACWRDQGESPGGAPSGDQAVSHRSMNTSNLVWLTTQRHHVA